MVKGEEFSLPMTSMGHQIKLEGSSFKQTKEVYFAQVVIKLWNFILRDSEVLSRHRGLTDQAWCLKIWPKV